MGQNKTTLFIFSAEERNCENRSFSHTANHQMFSGLPSLLTRRKRKDLELMEEAAKELLSYFSHRNVDALLKVTRNTLETMRKRIHSSSLLYFMGMSQCIQIFRYL